MFEYLKRKIKPKAGDESTKPQESIFYHSCVAIAETNHEREAYLLELSKDKNVLHFGFLDSPFLKEKIENNLLLHLKIKDVAKKIYGIDVDRAVLKQYRDITGDYNNCIRDIQSETFELGKKYEAYDLILFPEVLEHIINPGIALKNLYRLSKSNSAVLCITVPNAFNFIGYDSAREGVEFVHPDHYFYFSPVTLNKLLKDSGFTRIQISLYSHVLENNYPPGITKNGLIAVCEP